MRTTWIICFAAIIALVSNAGCAAFGVASAPKENRASGAPTVLTAEVAVWVHRAVLLQDMKGKPMVVHGLFACYRPTEPGHPRCYSARHRATRDDLTWPLPKLDSKPDTSNRGPSSHGTNAPYFSPVTPEQSPPDPDAPILIGSAVVLAQVRPRVEAWVGRQVRVVTKDGRGVDGKLGAVDASAIYLRTPTGRFMGKAEDVLELRLR